MKYKVAELNNDKNLWLILFEDGNLYCYDQNLNYLLITNPVIIDGNYNYLKGFYILPESEIFSKRYNIPKR